MLREDCFTLDEWINIQMNVKKWSLKHLLKLYKNEDKWEVIEDLGLIKVLGGDQKGVLDMIVS